MNARIDIKTPSGIPVEWFPFQCKIDRVYTESVWGILSDIRLALTHTNNLTLHPGDKIIIEVLP